MLTTEKKNPFSDIEDEPEFEAEPVPQVASPDDYDYEYEEEENQFLEDNPISIPWTLTGDELLSLDKEPKEIILDPWLARGNLVMVHAWRGIGKTQFAIGIGCAIASGQKFLKWDAPNKKEVLYIDGELPFNTLKDRVATAKEALDINSLENIMFITPEHTCDGYVPSISDVEGQSRYDTLIELSDVIILDNLSTLAGRLQENDSEQWGIIQSWLLKLRRMGKTVIIVHHSGKGLAQRGTSRREDILDTVIALKRPKNYDSVEGCCFDIHFEKARSIIGKDAQSFEAKLEADFNGKTIWTMKDSKTATRDKVCDLIKHEDLDNREIAQELEIHVSTVRKHRKNLKDMNLL